MLLLFFLHQLLPLNTIQWILLYSCQTTAKAVKLSWVMKRKLYELAWEDFYKLKNMITKNFLASLLVNDWFSTRSQHSRNEHLAHIPSYITHWSQQFLTKPCCVFLNRSTWKIKSSNWQGIKRAVTLLQLKYNLQAIKNCLEKLPSNKLG